MADSKQCAHELCKCGVSDDAEYCSPQCDTAEDLDLTEMKCDCGHSPCS